MPVFNGSLVTWNTADVANGLYWLKLSVNAQNGSSNVFVVTSVNINNSAKPPIAKIFSPTTNIVVTGTVQIFGTAYTDNIDYYQIEISPLSNSSNITIVKTVYQTVSNNLLATWNTLSVSNSVYLIKLRVADSVSMLESQATVVVTSI